MHAKLEELRHLYAHYNEALEVVQASDVVIAKEAKEDLPRARLREHCQNTHVTRATQGCPGHEEGAGASRRSIGRLDETENTRQSTGQGNETRALTES